MWILRCAGGQTDRQTDRRVRSSQQSAPPPGTSPVWVWGRCRISPPRFLAECCNRQLNQGSFVLLYFRLFTFPDLYWVFWYLPVVFCLSVSVKWLAVKTASEMTSVVSAGALNFTQTQTQSQGRSNYCAYWLQLHPIVLFSKIGYWRKASTVWRGSETNAVRSAKCLLDWENNNCVSAKNRSC